MKILISVPNFDFTFIFQQHQFSIFKVSLNQKEKENLFSVRGFETETSNFAPNGSPRVSTTQKFYARSDGWLRMIPRVLHIGHIYEKPAIWRVFYKFLVKFHTFVDVFRQKNVFFDHCASIWDPHSNRLEIFDL